MRDEELLNVWGGAFSAALVTAVVSAFKNLFDLGKSIGSAIRRVMEKKYCQVK